MVPAVVALLTRWSSAPGVHSGSGNPPTIVQPVVLLRGAGVQAETTTTGTDTAAVSTGAATGTSVAAGTAVGTPTTVGATVATGGTVSVGVSAGAAIGAAAGEQALRTSVAAIAIARRNTGAPAPPIRNWSGGCERFVHEVRRGPR